MLRKLLTLTTVLALSILPAAPAFAERREFPTFSIDVPAGWSVEQVGDTVCFAAPDDSSGLTITEGDAHGHSDEALAKAFSAELDGGVPYEVATGGYEFEFTRADSGLRGLGLVFTDEDGFLFLTVVGDEELPWKMLRSVKEKTTPRRP